MSDELDSNTPMTHWLIAGAGLIWNLFGLSIYVKSVQATPELMLTQGFSAEQISFLESVPAWATSANAIAVTAGVLACILLLLRKSIALPLFYVSLAAVLVQDLYAYVLRDSVAVFGMVPVYIQATVLTIAVLLIVYSLRAKKRGVLR